MLPDIIIFGEIIYSSPKLPRYRGEGVCILGCIFTRTIFVWQLPHPSTCIQPQHNSKVIKSSTSIISYLFACRSRRNCLTKIAQIRPLFMVTIIQYLLVKVFATLELFVQLLIMEDWVSTWCDIDISNFVFLAFERKNVGRDVSNLYYFSRYL